MRPGLQVAGQAGEEGLIPTTTSYGTALGDFLLCCSCGHQQLAEMPEVASAYEDAASEDYEAEEEGQRATARAELERIEHHAPGRGRLVDIGAWVGFLAAEAADRGWDVVGVEPSRWAADRARSRGVTILEESELPSGAFAAVTMGDVIEHLPDPGAMLDRVAELLAPGGVLWMATPDAGSRVAQMLGRRWWSVIPTHVHLFTRRSMRELLTRHGFEVLAMGTSPKTFSVAYYLERLDGYWPPLAKALVTAAQAAGVADRRWTPDFRDRFYVIAKRR
jgi:2-polyprenyl-3-methyl-5-hydroxy-6-metoxy-1,4-benzoquinol methylase